MLAGSILLLLMLLTPWGIERYGNRNWIQIPHFPMMLQPNEIVKIPFILILALLIIKIQDRGYSISSIPSVMQIGGFTVFMLGLIAAICHDMGTCAVYIMIFAFMAWSAGVKLRWFVLVGGGITLAVVIFWLFFLPETRWWTDYRIMRFRVVVEHWKGNDLDPLDKGWQQSQSLAAIGSGQLTGMGWMQGTRTHSASRESLNARHTDNIFAVCGEEFGMIGCCLLLLMLLLIILRCIWVSRRAKSYMSAYIAMGIAGMLITQTIINVAMCLYVGPVVGVTLPFFSYGGSSTLTLFIAMGLVSGIKMRPLPSWLKDRSQL